MPPTTTRVADDMQASFVGFRVGAQSYCVDIMSVREVRQCSATTALPHAPVHVTGVFNLRGQVVPVIDLATRLDVEMGARNEYAVFVIVAVNGRIVGMLVDAITDVFNVPVGSIHAVPDGSADDACVASIVTLGDRNVSVLDVQATVG